MRRGVLAAAALAALAISWSACASTSAAGDGPSWAFAKLDNIPVYYESVGAGETAVVFVHGWTCDGLVWQRQLDALRGRMRTIVIDLPGHGRSGKPQIEYTMDLFARSIEAVMRDAGVQRAVLVGHSMGVPVILRFYRIYPRETLALVAVDGALRPFFKERKPVDELLELYSGPKGLAARAAFADGMFTDLTPKDARERIRTSMIETPQHVAVSAMRSMFDPSAMVPERIDVPVLVVQAKSVVWTLEYQDYVKRIAPQLEYVEMEGVGHFLMLEKPARFNARLIEFLSRNGLL